MPQEVVRRKLALWQQHGVVREEAGGRYAVQETAPSSREKQDRSVLLMDSDEEGDSNTATQSEQREEKLRVNTHTHMCTRASTHTLTLIHTHSAFF